MGTSSLASSRALARIARRQAGCFTSSQAVEAGYGYPLHVYHQKSGGWVRLARGIYRLASAPDTPAVRLVSALLWPRNKAGAVPCALAGEAAEAVRAGRADAFSGPVELAVPHSFRYRSEPPAGVVVRPLPGETIPSQTIGLFRVLAEGDAAADAENPPKSAGKPRKTAKNAAKNGPKAVETASKALSAAGTTQERADWFDELDFRLALEDIRAASRR